MKLKRMLPVVAILVAGAALAQQKKGIIVEGGSPPDERGSARLLYWNLDTDSAAGQFAINYGRPLWRKDYEDPSKFSAMTEGKVWRMGSNYWTTLDTQLPLEISGERVEPGFYYLGLYRSPEGAQWSLALIDPVPVRAARTDAFEVAKAPILFKIPVTAAHSATPAERLTITLTHPKAEIRNATLNIAWVGWLLTAPVKVVL